MPTNTTTHPRNPSTPAATLLAAITSLLAPLLLAALPACTTNTSVPIDRRTGRLLQPDRAATPEPAPTTSTAFANEDPTSPAPAPSTRPLPLQPTEPNAFSTSTSLPMTFPSLAARAAAADVVILAEQHDDTAAQNHALRLINAVLDNSTRSPAVALEFLERDAQHLIDDYLTGIADDTTLDATLAARHQIDTITRRSIAGLTFDPRTIPEWSLPQAHRDAITAARDAGVPLIAANAPRRHVRYLRDAGPQAFDTLTPAQLQLVEPPGTLTTGPYRERFYELMSATPSHTGEPTDIDAFYLAQNIWDATMADSVTDALDAGHRPVILIVGQFHTDFNGGLVERIAQRNPGAAVYTISYQPVFSDQLRDEDRTRAAAVVYTAPPAQDD